MFDPTAPILPGTEDISDDVIRRDMLASFRLRLIRDRQLVLWGHGILAAITLALTWLCVAIGLAAKTVEAASNLPMPLTFLPFLGSGFVPTDSMPTGLRWFAEYQPFTPVIDTLRGLLLGTAIGDSAVVAVAWCAAITLAGYLWARRLYNRDPIR